MTNSIELLNNVQSLLVNFANDKGISLQDEFETVDNFKQFVIAFTFKQLVDLGVSVADAFDMTLGNGAYDNLVQKTWEAAQ